MSNQETGVRAHDAIARSHASAVDGVQPKLRDGSGMELLRGGELSAETE
jgi:hypothetical protein